jgi:hypothetical protein
MPIFHPRSHRHALILQEIHFLIKKSTADK